jgi:hypothetical protein
LNIPFFQQPTNVANQTYGGFNESGINSYLVLPIGYGNFFLNFTGRQDQYSVLSPENNTVFYPSAGVSFAFTDVIPDKPNWLTLVKLVSRTLK